MRRRKPTQESILFKPFDVTTKQLVETDPAAWIAYAGLPQAPVHIIDADLATIAVEADKVLRVQAPQPFLLNLEFQASYEDTLGDRVLLYSVLLRRRHKLPVKSVVILLRPEADGEAMTGQVRYEEEEEDFALDFRYRLMRVWQQPVKALLAGGLVTLPLAPLAAARPEELPGVIEQMQARISREADPAEAKTLWGATFLLLGLRYEAEFIEQLMKGVQGMEESSTYQLLIERGEERGKTQEARTILLRIGRHRFGEPDAAVESALAAAPLERLEQMADRLLEVESWQELLI